MTLNGRYDTGTIKHRNPLPSEIFIASITQILG
jgi:hypothetical protein